MAVKASGLILMLSERQGEGKGAAFAQLALHLDLSTVSSDEHPGNVESQADALFLFAPLPR